MSIEQEQASKITAELDRKLAYNSRFTHMDKAPAVATIRNELKKYGANSSDLKVINYLAKLMLDRACFIDKEEPTTEVSAKFLEIHKSPKKLEKILKRMGIYTLVGFVDKRVEADEDGTIPVDKDEVLTFIGKTPDNRILMTEIPQHKHYKAIPEELWCGLALLRFCEQIQSYQMLDMMGHATQENKINESVIQDLLKGTGTTFKLSEEELDLLKQHMGNLATDDPVTVQDMVGEVDDAEFRELV